MQSLGFYVVDVFAEEKYAGNQLAVIRNAESLSSSEMQRIANEMHFSETTFILSDKQHQGGYDVRIFTPQKELPFAGHPTLGTAYVIWKEILEAKAERVVLNLKVGRIPVACHDVGEKADICWMKQMEPIFSQTFRANIVAKVLRINPDEIDKRFSIQEVSTGVFFIIAPLKTLASLKKASISKEEYCRLIENSRAKAILVFCPQTRSGKNDLSVRVFADYYGIPEDPATGSANGCLAAYLVKHRYYERANINVQVEQGHEIGRPSLLHLKAKETKEGIDINVGGKVVMVAKGQLV